MRQRLAHTVVAGAIGVLVAFAGAVAANADPSDPGPIPSPSPLIEDFVTAQIPAIHQPGNQTSQSNVQGGNVIRGGIGMFCQNPGVECRPPGRSRHHE